MSRYDSRRRAESVRAWRPFQTPACEVCTVYRQQWQRADGGAARVFEVLALDADQALAMGRLRLEDRYHQNANAWRNVLNKPIERVSSSVTTILTIETAGEEQLRETVYRDRHDKGEPVTGEATR